MAVIIDAVRTCSVRQAGALRSWHAADLLAYTLRALVDRVGLDPARVDNVVAACRTTVGEQAMNVARSAVLSAQWPESLAASTIEGSGAIGVVALRNAAALIDSGVADAIVVTGVEMPSRVPAGAAIGTAVGKPFGPGVHARFADAGGLLPPGLVAESLARRHGVDRIAMDAWAEQSLERAHAHQEAGRAKSYLLSVPVRPDRITEVDAWQHGDDLLPPGEDLGALAPSFEVDGIITARNMAQPSDGAAALLLASSDFASSIGADSLVDIAAAVVSGSSVLDGSSGYDVARAAAPKLLSVGSVDVHEDFAATPLAFLAEARLDAGLVNATGGALARGECGGAAVLGLVCEAAHRAAEDSKSALVVGAGASDLSGAVHLLP